MAELGVKPDRAKVAVGLDRREGRAPEAQRPAARLLAAEPARRARGAARRHPGQARDVAGAGRGRRGAGPRPRAPAGARRARAERQQADVERHRLDVARKALTARLTAAAGAVGAEFHLARPEPAKIRTYARGHSGRRSRDRANALAAFAGRRRGGGRGRRVAQRAPPAPPRTGPTAGRPRRASSCTTCSPTSARRSPSPTAPRRMRYANQAAADLLGCATPEELLDLPLGTIAAQWESTHEDGRPMVAEDVPELQDRQRPARRAAADADRQPRDRRAALAAGQGRAAARPGTASSWRSA